MKKILYITLIFTIATITSCSRVEKDIFDKSAAERLQDYLNNAKATLAASPNGWEMLYFIGTEKVGYNVLVKLEANGKATVAAKNALITSNVYKSAVSTWNVLGDDGPTLSFDTFNEVLHQFSDPADDGLGNEGDYEFNFLTITEDQLILKGKKHNAYIVMNKLSETQDWETYFADVEANSQLFFSGKNILDLEKNGVLYNAHNGSSGYFVIVNDGATNLEENNTNTGIITTQRGIYMQNAFQADNQRPEEYILNEGKTALIAANGTRLYISSLPTYFEKRITTSTGWVLNTMDINTTDAAHIATINNTLASLANNSFIASMTLGYNSQRASYVLQFKYRLSGTIQEPEYFDFDVKKEGQNVILTYKATHSSGAQTLLNKLVGLSDFVSNLSGTYTLSTETTINPTNSGFRLTSTTDTTKWYNMTFGSL